MNLTYVSFLYMWRDQTEQLNKELEKWVIENIPESEINYSSWRLSGKKVLIGAAMDREQRTFFKLKFGK